MTAPRTRRSTPARLRIYLGLVWVLGFLLLLVGEGTLARARRANKVIGRDAAPSIIAAQEIAANLADLDANAANALLGNRQQQAAAQGGFEGRRTKLTERLCDAAGNVTFGEEERAPLRDLFDGIGRYLELVSEAHVRATTSDAAGALAAYRTATEMAHNRLLPAASRLDAANRKFLDASYTTEMQGSTGVEAVAALVGLALVVVLVHAQIFSALRLRRRFNPALLAATALATAFTVYLVVAMGNAKDDLRRAKVDAFDSIHDLWRARAIAFDANGDESRYLLDPERARYFQDAFRARVAELTTRPRPTNAELADPQKRAAIGGLFGKELKNVTFPGELAAALEVLRTFSSYSEIDERMRMLEAAKRHPEAIDLCIGSRFDGSNAAFDKLDAAIGKTIDLNRREFDSTIDAADHALGLAAILDPLLSLSLAVLAWVGIRPRLKEYA